MLSYRHSFHAGNFADVLKHYILVEILEALAKKDKPFEYIDTHAGAGLHYLHSEQAQKLAEFTNGIGRLTPKDWPELGSYFTAINACNPTNQLTHYPGSPLIANHFLRRQDRGWLYELHPSDAKLLQKNLQKKHKMRVMQGDGFTGLLSLLPPTSRRGVVLIDPSYEIKSDYEKVFSVVNQAYKKFANGIYAIWYPVVDRELILRLEKKFINSGIKDIQRFELGIKEDTTEHGMTSSGMLVINPPWELHEKMSKLLPKLAKHLGSDENGENSQGVFKCDVLVKE